MITARQQVSTAYTPQNSTTVTSSSTERATTSKNVRHTTTITITSTVRPSTTTSPIRASITSILDGDLNGGKHHKCPENHREVWCVKGQRYAIACGFDYAGNDIKPLYGTVDVSAACALACAENPDCHAWSFNKADKRCFLKDAANMFSARANENVFAGITMADEGSWGDCRTEDAFSRLTDGRGNPAVHDPITANPYPPDNTNGPKCPDNHGEVHCFGHVNVVIGCGWNQPDNDIDRVTSPSLGDCASRCIAMQEGCLGVVYDPVRYDCWLKGHPAWWPARKAANPNVQYAWIINHSECPEPDKKWDPLEHSVHFDSPFQTASGQ